jgi:hypothetical protein
METTIEMNQTTCCACGITFAFEKSYFNRLRENHNTFYCPNGHPLHIIGKTEAELLNENLEQVKKERDNAILRANEAEIKKRKRNGTKHI